MRPLLMIASLCLSAVLAPAQEVGEVRGDDAIRGPASPYTNALRAARDAMARDEPQAAAGHLQNALWYQPFDDAVLQDLLRCCAAEPEALRAWRYDWTLATMDDKGHARAARDVAALLGDDHGIDAIAEGRVAAAAELVRFATGLKSSSRKPTGDSVLAQWALELGHELLSPSPSLAKLHESALVRTRDRLQMGHEPTIQAVRRLMDRSATSGRHGDAVRAARCLLGFASQAAFKDLKGPRPDGVEDLKSEAGAALARAREALARDMGTPWSVDDLAMMDEDQAARFSEEHSTFANPGVALSPNGLYRIETPCGHGTLLGVADTVEDHHRRLVNWFGQDPFEGRPGVVRVVPEHAELESEGAPFWWAGGFQGGDTTTLKFSCGTIEGLGHGLTHELTHRFDGAVYGGLPAWLMEGRAVWTGAAYGRTLDTSFAEFHASFGTIEQALIKGYGAENKLKELIDGSLEDYRDNYTAGYALYVYLNTWMAGDRFLFRGPLQHFMETASSARRGPLEHFTSHFADGNEGRPEDFTAFTKGFGEFIGGFYWQNRQPWTQRYAVELEGPKQTKYVYDRATWVWSRHRAEPFFGQDQAALAGDLLWELGDKDGALGAWLWSLEVDEWNARRAHALADLLDAQRKKAAAWVLRAHSGDVQGPAPMLSSLPRLRSLLEAYAKALEFDTTAGHWRMAAILGGDHDRLARLVGLPSITPHHPELEAATPWHGTNPPAHTLGLRGWVEDELSGYDERRVADLWYETDTGDVHVGRRRPREGTGQMDRAAHQRDAFVRSAEWQRPGRYLARARVHCTTSFVSGAMILGRTRRDRYVRVGFSAGDFLYSVGEKDKPAELDSVSVNVSGLRERDDGLGGSNTHARVEFERPRGFFDLEVVVENAEVMVSVDGALVARYHTVDGNPIEGTIGFAMGHGAVRVQSPTVRRLDRSDAAILDDGHERSLRWERPVVLATDFLRNRHCPDLPPTEVGTLVLWIPTAAGSEGFDAEEELYFARRDIRSLAEEMQELALPQALAVALPSAYDDELMAALKKDLHELVPQGCHLILHAWTDAPPGEDWESGEVTPYLFFVDSQNILRQVQPFLPGLLEVSGGLRHWTKVFAAEGPAPAGGDRSEAHDSGDDGANGTPDR